MKAVGNCLVATSAKDTIVISAQTTFRFDDLRTRHIENYSALYSRMQLQLHSGGSDLLTDRILQSTSDLGLVALYLNYVQYLLISCSRPGP
jgi:hypothetical protein